MKTFLGILIIGVVGTLHGHAGQARQQSGTIVSGIVRDADSGIPIENAIVYIPGSTIGTTTTADGRFAFRVRPAGEFGLTISRVGYGVVTRTVDQTNRDSLFLDIVLQQQPVVTPGIDVSALPPTDSLSIAPPVFLPKDAPGVVCVYGAASQVPIAIISTDSAFYMLAFDTEYLDGELYLRVWTLYQNISDSPYDFNPMASVRLTVKGSGNEYRLISPEPPSTVASMTDSARIASTVSQSVGMSLTSLAEQRTAYLYNDKTFLLLLALGGLLEQDRTRTVDRPVSFTPSGDESLSGRLYRIFSGSVPVGILRPYTVYPGNSVNGVLYFPFPGFGWSAGAGSMHQSANYTYEIRIETPNGTRSVEFVPN